MAVFGLGQQKPHHYREMARVAWENRDQLPFAWRILTRRRLRRLRARHDRPPRLDARGHAPLHGAARADAPEHGAGARSRRRSRDVVDAAPAGRSAELRALGRLPEPMLRRRGERGFRVVTWDEALDAAARRPARHRPGAARLLPDLARHHERGLLRGAEGGALPRHQPRRQLGAALPRRLDRGDEGDARLRRLHLQLHRLARRRPHRASSARTRQQPAGHDEVPAPRARQRGAQVAVVNPYREPGLERYWVPSIAASAIVRHRASPTTGSTCTPAATSRS